MGNLIYLMNVSLDGFVETPARSTDWTTADDELLRWFSQQSRQVSAFLYGRLLYEVMAAYWPHAESDPAATEPMLEYAEVWLRTPKIVFSSTLEDVGWNSRLVRGDPVGELAHLRTEFDGNMSVGGPRLASAFIARDLVDEYQLVVHPVAIGAGTPYFPPLDRTLRLRPTGSHRFTSGAFYIGYSRIRSR